MNRLIEKGGATDKQLVNSLRTLQHNEIGAMLGEQLLATTVAEKKALASDPKRKPPAEADLILKVLRELPDRMVDRGGTSSLAPFTGKQFSALLEKGDAKATEDWEKIL